MSSKLRGADAGRRRAGWWLVGVLVFAVAFAAVLGVLTFRGLGRWLIVSDPLTPARAIVVIIGHYPFGAMEAATIYRQGWAPEIWLTRTRSDERVAALLPPGASLGTQDHLNREVLERLGVPAPAVRLLTADMRNTADELRVVAAAFRSSGADAVIAVTSKSHTRRVRATWRAVVGDRPRVIVRAAPGDPFNGERWWRDDRATGIVSHEVFGLLNVWAGMPVRPDGRE
jgi:uncharacterized SAM-binding protein YcdF (DUF218 family)